MKAKAEECMKLEVVEDWRLSLLIEEDLGNKIVPNSSKVKLSIPLKDRQKKGSMKKVYTIVINVKTTPRKNLMVHYKYSLTKMKRSQDDHPNENKIKKQAERKATGDLITK